MAYRAMNGGGITPKVVATIAAFMAQDRNTMRGFAIGGTAPVEARHHFREGS